MSSLGRMGEEVAARFLMTRGATILARNPRQGRGEIDLLARFGNEVVAVEVKTRRAATMDPAEAFTPEKVARVRSLAARVTPPAHRLDLVAVTVEPGGLLVRWLPRAG